MSVSVHEIRRAQGLGGMPNLSSASSVSSAIGMSAPPLSYSGFSPSFGSNQMAPNTWAVGIDFSGIPSSPPRPSGETVKDWLEDQVAEVCTRGRL